MTKSKCNTKTINFWGEHFSQLQKSLVAQIQRILTGSGHSTIKGSSMEVVLQRVLSDYLPSHFSVRHGQIANNKGDLSPQQDIIVYDGNAFPHLSVNEDSSVIVCCESVLATIECKTYWEQKEVEKHYRRTTKVEDKWHDQFKGREELRRAGYFVLYYKAASPNINSFKRKNRTIGIYCLKNNKSWSKPRGSTDFCRRSNDALQSFFQDLLKSCMGIGQVEIGTFDSAYSALRSYLGWEESNNEET